jgi:uncharacterized protein
MEGLEYFPPAQTHLIRSSFVAQTYKVQVALPEQRRGETTRFPVVYVTDGNRVFEMFRAISQILQASGYDAPRFALVSIGYPGDSPRAGALLRTRDFTFPGYPALRLVPPPAEGVPMPEEGTPHMNGAADFSMFIEQELVPFIDRTYETIPGDRTYFGHSGGGAYGLYLLFTRAHLFRSYIVSSPSLTFQGELDGVHYDDCDFAFQEARSFIASRPRLSGQVRLHMSVGTEEEFEQALRPWQLTSSFYRMAQLLKAAEIAGLQVTSEAISGQTHMSVWPIAFVHGVQAVFGSRVRTA